MCSSQPDCLDVVWNICVVQTPVEDRQERDREGEEQRRGGVEGRDPSIAQKDVLSFSITSVATTAEAMLPQSRAKGQCEADERSVHVPEEDKEVKAR